MDGRDRGPRAAGSRRPDARGIAPLAAWDPPRDSASRPDRVAAGGPRAGADPVDVPRGGGRPGVASGRSRPRRPDPAEPSARRLARARRAGSANRLRGTTDPAWTAGTGPPEARVAL